MGQQQLLLLVLTAILVGVGVLFGVNMFQESAAQANLDSVTQDCMAFVAKAQAWYRYPMVVGGGGQDYTGFSWGDINLSPDAGPYVNENGSYVISGNAVSSFVITGTCKQDPDGDGTPASVVVTVTGNGVTVTKSD